MSLQRGKPEPEVIVNFADGLAYNKAKLEAAVFGGTIFSGKPPKHAHKDTSVKDDDVALITKELDLTKAEAERALVDAQGDVENALKMLIGL